MKVQLRRKNEVYAGSTPSTNSHGYDDDDDDCDSHSSDSDYDVADNLQPECPDEIHENNIYKVLKNEGMYRYMRRNVGGYQRSVDYCHQVKHLDYLTYLS
jgi:hypothetical protein